MAVGFQVMFPGGGQAQIDDTYRNYHLRKSGTFYNGDFVNDPNQAYSPSRRARINLAGMNSPVVVLRPLGSNGQTMCGIEYGQGWADVLCWYNAVQTAGVEYYVYDDYSPPPVNYGLEIYNAQGRRVYHSNWRRMRVLGMRVIPASGTPSLTRLTDYSISDIAALSSKSGFLMPYTRIGTQAVAEGGQPHWPTGGMYVLSDAAYYKSNSVLTWGTVSHGYSDGWWEPVTGWMNKGPLTVLFVDLDHEPMNYS